MFTEFANFLQYLWIRIRQLLKIQFLGFGSKPIFTGSANRVLKSDPGPLKKKPDPDPDQIIIYSELYFRQL